MGCVTTGLAVGVCVSPGPVRKAILENSVTRPPRTVARVGCPSTAIRMLSAASMTQPGQSFWYTHSGGHVVIVCTVAVSLPTLQLCVSLCTCCTELLKRCSQPATLEIRFLLFCKAQIVVLLSAALRRGCTIFCPYIFKVYLQGWI